MNLNKKLLSLGGIIILSSLSLGAERTTYLAGGCFWCTESDMEKIPGIIDVVSGYSGGNVENPLYKEVSSGKTGHIETIRVKYDDEKISYSEVLDSFLRIMDPTDGEGQFVDRGYQYSPTIFYENPEEEKIAKKALEKIKVDGKFDKIATKLIPFKNFYDAEDYHQDYAKKNPIRYEYYRNRSGRDQFLKKVWGEKSQ
ncbi:MAG: peptide-methionine (S)-S-oxide reductase MsrA [Fusobacteriaceae bacterium]